MNINIRVLGSTSYGNSTLIWDDNDIIMIDCGFSVKYTRHNLEKLDLNLSSLSGVFLTHMHTDHLKTSMLNRLNKEEIPVFCHHALKHDLINNYTAMRKSWDQKLLQTYSNEEINLGSFTIKGFEVQHDSNGGCFGYNIFNNLKSGLKKITIATDLGYPDDYLIENFLNSDVIIIESNHDVQMLEDSNRPWFLKQRIKKAHLSNDKCAKFIANVLDRSDKKPKAIILAHISQECNTNHIAKDCTKKILCHNNHNDIKIIMTHKMMANEIVKLE